MNKWIHAAELADCPPGTTIERIAAGRIVAIYNVDGEILATDGICAHQGGPLGKGSLDGCTITCPWHGWQYDVRSGQQSVSDTIRVRTFPVRIKGDSILIGVEEGTTN